MAQASHGNHTHGDHTHGHMDIKDQRDTFSGFMAATVWGCCLLAQGLALATLAFAIGAGWWAGLGVFILIGIVAGMVFKLGGGWWATQVALLIVLGLGGLVAPLVAG